MSADRHFIGHLGQRRSDFFHQISRFALHAHATAGEHGEVGFVDDLDAQTLFVSGDRDLVFHITELFVLSEFLFDFFF